LRRKGVTLQLVWEEYRAAHPNGYGRSWFCELYRAWEGRLSPTMRQAHVAGEKLFVDYAGTTIDIVDAKTGEVHACQLFVAALGASSFTYAEATFTQTLPDWIGSHTRAFGFYGGVPALVVSDNLKSGVTKACFYEPGVNRAYAEMATTTTRPLCRHGRESRATRQKSRSPCRSRRAGLSPSCATSGSSRSSS
jgi:transposase